MKLPKRYIFFKLGTGLILWAAVIFHSCQGTPERRIEEPGTDNFMLRNTSSPFQIVKLSATSGQLTYQMGDTILINGVKYTVANFYKE